MSRKEETATFGYEEAAIVRAMIQHENELRNNRIVWFITIEGLLFAALGFAWKDAHLLIYVLCALGIVTAISSSRELVLSSRGITELKDWWHGWLQRSQPLTYSGPPVIGLDAASMAQPIWGLKLRPARALPWIFVGAWGIVILIFSLSSSEEIHKVRLVSCTIAMQVNG